MKIKKRFLWLVFVAAVLIGIFYFIYPKPANSHADEIATVEPQVAYLKADRAVPEPVVVPVDPKHERNLILGQRIIKCESSGDPTAKNPNSSASGLAGFIKGTWDHYSKLHWGDTTRSVFDGKANHELLIWVLDNYGTGDWEADPASYACWHG